MTKRECAVVMAYTGTVMLQGEDFNIYHKYVTELLGRPVLTHELPGLTKVIRERAKKDFMELCFMAED